mgnify:CR=1 FL=1
MDQRFIEKYGPWAIVTGASSGIGAAFARQLAKNGMHLVLAARREQRLRAIQQELETVYPIQVRIVSIDLSQEDFLFQMIPITEDIPIGLVVHSAGFSIVNDFLENDLRREIEMLHVNNRAGLILSHYYGRKMKAMNRGGLIFISSTAAFIPSPPWSHYVATKAYDRLLGECLAEELKKDGIDVLVLCPGGVQTEFQQVAGADSRSGNPILRFVVTELPPSAVAQAGIRWLGRKSLFVVGFRNQLLVFLARFVPRRLAIRLTYRVMENFKKRSSLRSKQDTIDKG